ncbi:hypothetical protein K439DRAFT_1614144 [Ramaria rubella]|nr:hypothetical protein K439DRAFT_1614144 [Ramaria rubella]
MTLCFVRLSSDILGLLPPDEAFIAMMPANLSMQAPPSLTFSDFSMTSEEPYNTEVGVYMAWKREIGLDRKFRETSSDASEESEGCVVRGVAFFMCHHLTSLEMDIVERAPTLGVVAKRTQRSNIALKYGSLTEAGSDVPPAPRTSTHHYRSLKWAPNEEVDRLIEVRRVNGKRKYVCLKERCVHGPFASKKNVSVHVQQHLKSGKWFECTNADW